MEHANRRVLLIGWDAADWIIIQQLLDAGRMPHLARFIEQGVMGNLASLVPCLSPMLWTSAATGKTADKHGVLGFVEPSPDGLSLLPFQRTRRRCKALWNMLEDTGLRACVVAWPVSDPVEPLRGVYISERMTEGLADQPQAIGPVAAGCVHPATLEPFISELRLHPCELAATDLRSLIPAIDTIDLNRDPRPAQLARLFARCVSVHTVATAVLEAESWDFCAVYYDALDRGGHDFMAYRAPRMAHITEEDHHDYGEVINGLYEFHDAMLGRLLELAGDDTTVIIMSDHGFQSGARRPVEQHEPDGTVAATGADWHRMLGVFAMKGPGIRQDERIYGASLLDITPTVLTLFGLPVGQDMDGRVLTGAFCTPPAIQWIKTWETTAPDDTALPLPAPGEQAALVERLVALGYLSADALETATAVDLAEREMHFNLASVHLHHGRPAEALPLLEGLCNQYPTEQRYALARLHALSRLGRTADVLADIARLDAAGWVAVDLDLLAAKTLGAEGQDAAALARFAALVARVPDEPLIYQVLGDYHSVWQRWSAAEAAFTQALALDPESVSAHSGMAHVALARGEFAQAAEYALTSLQHAFWNPVMQCCLGRALAAMEAWPEARRAFEFAVEQAPDYGDAHYRLALVLEQQGDLMKAAYHRQRAQGLSVNLPL